MNAVRDPRPGGVNAYTRVRLNRLDDDGDCSDYRQRDKKRPAARGVNWLVQGIRRCISRVLSALHASYLSKREYKVRRQGSQTEESTVSIAKIVTIDNFAAQFLSPAAVSACLGHKKRFMFI